MKRFLSLVFLLVAIAFTGCARVGESYVGQLDAAAGTHIAGDAAARLVALYPPGHTSLHLIVPAKTDTFSTNFEGALRSKGFTLSNTGSVSVAWVLDSLGNKQEQTWYLRLKVSDGKGLHVFSRAYSGTGEPLAGFAALQD